MCDNTKKIDYTKANQRQDRCDVRWAASSFGGQVVTLPGRYRSIYIRQDRIKAKHPRPILVDDRQGLVIACGGVQCHGPSKLVYKPDADESCLWLESESSVTLTDPEVYDNGPTD